MEAYAGKQFVGIDLHRRRSVIVRTTEAGEVLEAVRIINDVQRLASVMARAGQCPEVVHRVLFRFDREAIPLEERPGCDARVRRERGCPFAECMRLHVREELPRYSTSLVTRRDEHHVHATVGTHI
jgi:hypothetical protein